MKKLSLFLFSISILLVSNTYSKGCRLYRIEKTTTVKQCNSSAPYNIDHPEYKYVGYENNPNYDSNEAGVPGAPGKICRLYEGPVPCYKKVCGEVAPPNGYSYVIDVSPDFNETGLSDSRC